MPATAVTFTTRTKGLRWVAVAGRLPLPRPLRLLALRWALGRVRLEILTSTGKVVARRRLRFTPAGVEAVEL